MLCTIVQCWPLILRETYPSAKNYKLLKRTVDGRRGVTMSGMHTGRQCAHISHILHGTPGTFCTPGEILHARFTLCAHFAYFASGGAYNHLTPCMSPWEILHFLLRNATSQSTRKLVSVGREASATKLVASLHIVGWEGGWVEWRGVEGGGGVKAEERQTSRAKSFSCAK